MLVVITSVDTISTNDAPEPAMLNVLTQVRAQGTLVAIVSNREKPNWLDGAIHGADIEFIKTGARQDGEVIKIIANHFKVPPYDILVLASKDEDIAMAKNGGALLIATGWTQSRQASLGICIKEPSEFLEVIQLINEWKGHWWFEGKGDKYNVYALVNLSTYHQPPDQEAFANKVRSTAKHGGVRLVALLTATARSLLIDGVASTTLPLWGVYPSSSSSNDDTEVLSDFTHRLRTTATRCQMARRGEPLFIRHTPSLKRSGGSVANREHPAGQLDTVHLNPAYRGKIKKRNVIVIDDCTTYGVSFGVAAALLYAAGATSVIGVALGKFGNQIREYVITINGDPFQPLSKDDYKLNLTAAFNEKTDSTTQKLISTLIP